MRKKIIHKGMIIEVDYADLWRLYKGFSHWMVFQMIPKNSQYYDDYMQVARISLWKAFIRYDVSFNRSFLPYAKQEIKWKLMELYHAIRKSNVATVYLDAELPNQDNHRYADMLAGPDRDPAKIADLQAAWAYLPEEDKQLLAMMAYGYKQTEIRQMLRLPYGSGRTSTKIKAARERLRNLYEKGLPAPQTQTAHTS